MSEAKKPSEEQSEIPPGEVRLVNGWPVVNVGRPITMEEIQDFLAEDE